MRKVATSLCLVVLASAAGDIPVRDFPVKSLEGVVSKRGVQLDTKNTSDGNGALRLSTGRPRTFTLYEAGDLDVEQTRLIYKAKMRTRGVKGDAYLEMQCHLPELGQISSRGLQYAVSGKTDWVDVETEFVLRKGENPGSITLSVVIEGRGTVWIDEIQLVKRELPD